MDEMLETVEVKRENSEGLAQKSGADLSVTDSHLCQNTEMKENPVDAVPVVKVEAEEDKESTCANENSSEKSGKFHVDRSLIPVAQLNDLPASFELQELGLDVFNQDDFEQGVMAQVDQVLAHEEEERKKNILEKEMKAVEDDIKMVKQELLDMERVLVSLSSGQSDYTKRRIESVRRQKENKMNQMRKLRAKQKSLHGKVPGVSIEEEEGEEEVTLDINQMLGLTSGPSKESEREKMIRLGEMTPFGTVVSKSTSSAKKPAAISLSQNSSFDQFFMEKDQTRVSQKKQPDKVQTELSKKLERMKASLTEDSKKTEKKKKSEQSTSDNDKKKEKSKKKSKKENFFDKRDKKRYRDDVEGADFSNLKSSKPKYPGLNRNFREDPAMSDGEYEYQPNELELAEISDQSDQELQELMKKKLRKKKGFGRPKKPPKYKESDSDYDSEEAGSSGRKQFSRDGTPRKVKDDGNDYNFEKRIREFNVAERERLQRVENREESEEEDEELEGGLWVPGRIWSRLFKYQQTGVSWLWELHGQQAGGIVGDEMGLGKTIQMIAFLAALRHSRLKDKNFTYHGLGPTLIVCPTTVMYQWVKEFHVWWPLFRVAILHSSGSYTCSEAELVRTIVKDRGVLVTSFNTLVIHQEILVKYNWHYVVLDEGHKIRNPDAQVTVACKQFRTYHRIILSGSPIQNNLKELWSLFDFVFPGKLGTLPDFMAHFSVPIVQGGYSNASQVQVMTAYKCACVLRDTINPYLLRRMKADVKIDLPSKNEQVLFCRLSDEQREVYTEYLQSRECQAILSGKFQVFAGLITLRKICNHPDLCTGGPRLYIGEEPGDDEDLQFGHKKRSGKMIVVDALLKLWKKQGHRALFFTQSRAMLDIMESFVQKKDYNYLRMDGGTPISARQSLINRFNHDSSVYLFLLTTRVGGLGVNLIGANRVIIFDPDWNPSTDTQARERTWRIGQDRQVTIYRLVTTGTIEEKIYHRQIFKQFLTNRVLKDPKQRRFFKSNDLYELFELGNDDNRGQTETGALFAGTGSEVKVSSLMSHTKSKNYVDKDDKKKKANRFDIIYERKLREKKEKQAGLEYSDEENSDKEVEGMQILADRIRQELKREENKSHFGVSHQSKKQIRRRSSSSEVKIKSEDSEDSRPGNAEITSRPNSAEITSRPSSAEITSRPSSEEITSRPSSEEITSRPSSAELVSKQNSADKESEHKPSQSQNKAILEKILKRKHNLQSKLDSDRIAKLGQGEKDKNEIRESLHRGGSVMDRSHTVEDKSKCWENCTGKGESIDLEEDFDYNVGLYTSTSNNQQEVPSGSSKKESEHTRCKEGESGSRHRKHDKKEDDRRKKHRHKEDRASHSKDEDQERKRKHRKRKHRDAKFEGTRIPNLVKQDEYNSNQSKEEEDKKMDDYVLKTLFKKTGIQSALKHDVIMDASKHDYMIVEVEADRVAKEAMKALKRSRSQCSSAITGVPTWTGQSGAVKKPRFGQKKNSLLTDKSTKGEPPRPVQPRKPESTVTSSTASKHHFDGSLAGNVVKDIETGATGSSMMSSGELLSRMRQRNEATQQLAVGEEGENEGMTADPEAFKLITDIRNYILFECNLIGEASTDEIIAEFGPKLPDSDSVKFRSMLKEICDYEKRNGVGFWKLRQDFR